jgi:hypothetical protein
MIAEVSLAILSATLRVAAVGRRAFVRVNLEADLAGVCQHQDVACSVAFRMTDERVFAGGRGRSQKTMSPTLYPGRF